MRGAAGDQALAVMQAAVKQSGRQSFFRTSLFRLWPDAQPLLVEVSRRLGDEIRLPEDRQPLLVRSLRAGVAHFNSLHKPRSRHGFYRLADWESRSRNH